MRSQRLAGHLSAAARTIHALSLPIILFWVALTIVVNVVAPQLQSVARTHSVALGPHDAPSLIAMKRIGKDFQQFDSDTTAMVLLEGQEKLGDEAHRFYDVLVTKLSQDTTLNRPGMSGDSSSWKGWGHVRWFIEEVPAGAA
ncbi:transmembrane transport protein mmpL1 [Mycobacterium tuberculosis]|nr:transmembrane transport protein mmpL1 [Mycobacterium tuberculosis]